jgi:hypothetical protein
MKVNRRRDSIVLLFIWGVILGCSQDIAPTPTSAVEPAKIKLPMAERKMVNVSSNGIVTTRLYRRSSPPPWEDGNQLYFRFEKEPEVGLWEVINWRVVNMHSENLFRITQELKTESVEMLIIPVTNYIGRVQKLGSPERPVLTTAADALVIDPRIPRSWFLEEPRNARTEGLKNNYPDFFRQN